MNWVSTTENEKWSKNNEFSDRKGEELIIGEKQGKPLYGWGCCISEICAKAIFGLSKDKQKAIFDELFNEDGCGSFRKYRNRYNKSQCEKRSALLYNGIGPGI